MQAAAELGLVYNFAFGDGCPDDELLDELQFTRDARPIPPGSPDQVCSSVTAYSARVQSLLGVQSPVCSDAILSCNRISWSARHSS